MIEWFARNGVAANLLMVLILALGLHALSSRIPLELLPETELAAVDVAVTWRGATPVEVEEGIVTRMEEAISDLAGIERMVSEARAESARVRVEVDGGYDSRELLEIAIEIGQHNLERFGIGFDDVVTAIRNASKDYPAGSLKTRRGEILLRTRGQAYTKADFERIVVLARSDGTRLTLADIAEVKDGFAEGPLHTRFNGRPAVLLKIYRTGDQSAFAMARQARDYMDGIRPRLPPGVRSIWTAGGISPET
uniref:AcrB/AcrD/AcrF family protein n=1 Tax=Candidatus Kentrum eta TaxID=2126337 RepID=A0A450UUA0_9GAMM|nr:MAG: AcrB/AcrD/AcrF family protein [Candidatus Kentron sp. H]VFJ89416.1 MAG: AcrB/AcrD/AcrF family protein [Candidatus Kentron sp. H]VFJ96020.1 MAG: AcrB/AcrD/AcrF family protein [Candidatus Kentron sp. H]